LRILYGEACGQENPEKLPQNCPMKNEEMVRDTFETYKEKEITNSTSNLRRWRRWLGALSRMKDTIELCRHMNYKKIGVAFCRGLASEAKQFATCCAKRPGARFGRLQGRRHPKGKDRHSFRNEGAAAGGLRAHLQSDSAGGADERAKDGL
jgi:hypothetical protein